MTIPGSIHNLPLQQSFKRNTFGGTIMETTKPNKTISQVFEEFLADQKDRIGPKTFSKYKSIIQLYGSYLESYWPSHIGEYDKITKAGGTYCSTFGPEDVTDGYSEFLGYFMPRKVLCGKETMQAAGTVTKKLAKWLAEKGYIEDTEHAQEQAGAAAKELPNAQEVLDLLNSYLDETTPAAHEGEPAKHGGEIEDHFWIERIEPGRLWLKPLTASDSVIGPVPVPRKVTQLCQPMWDIGGVVAKGSKGWRLVEVWNVSP
jgi:hypothetical protein